MKRRGKRNWIIMISGCAVAYALQLACTSTSSNTPLVQAHRGGAALYPENTIPAMIHAIDLGITTLEMDLHVTSDSQVVVSHDAYLNAVKALKPDGSEIPADSDKTYAIYKMTYDSLRRYDVGSRHNPAYPRRVDMKCEVPRISDLIDSVETYTSKFGITPVNYNIEIKSWPDKDGIYSPDYKTFADLCMRELLSKNLGSRLLVQCFDARTLNYVHSKYPEVRLSYLVEDKNVNFDELMKRINFIPEVISPDYQMVDADFIKNARKLGMTIVPWTVDKKADVMSLRELGVDEIITNQPDSVMEWLKK